MSSTTATSSSEEIRARVHQMWGSVAPAWQEHAAHVEERAAAATRRIIEAVAPAPGDDVLELASGAGGLGLTVAPLVAPGGSVVISDVAPEMVAIAAARAALAAEADDALGQVRAQVLDLEEIAVPDASFDVVVCREGLMFALDPARAAREIARVLRPGGRLGVAVWGTREQNPWLGVLADVVHEHTGLAVPPPGTPGPFSLGAEGALEEVLTGAGLVDVDVQEVQLPTHDASFEDYWQLRTDLAGPLKRRLAALEGHGLEAVRDAVRERLAAYLTPDGLRIPGLARIGSARRRSD